MATVSPPPKRSGKSHATHLPQTKVTRYDITTAMLIACLGMLVMAVITLIAIWLANMIPTKVTLAPMMTPGDGGYEDGEENATPDVESPEDPTDDPSVSNDQSNVTELMEITDPVMEAADSAAALVEPTSFTDPNNSGNPGSAEGTGGRPLGSGGPGRGGAKREQRWFVQFAEKGDLKSYARQLDFFKIELGAMFAAQQKLYYMSNVSSDRPTIREVSTGDNEKRLFMNWEGGERKKADEELFQKAGIDATQAAILHFYPTELEQQLAQLELSFAGRPAEQIRRTYFEVQRSGSGYAFKVTDQKLK
ncbi:MAG: hypothetical protein KDA91_04975 [Planctomycetaceae bacterium]|nr:hypothetical protein [Planctomycetaceae bacterium]